MHLVTVSIAIYDLFDRKPINADGINLFFLMHSNKRTVDLTIVLLKALAK